MPYSSDSLQTYLYDIEQSKIACQTGPLTLKKKKYIFYRIYLI